MSANVVPLCDPVSHPVQDPREGLEAAVLACYDMADPILRKAVEMWQENRREALQEDPVGPVVHSFAAEEMFKEALAYHRADIEENIAVLKAKLATERREAAAARFRLSIGEHEGFFLEEDDHICLHQMEIQRRDKVRERARLRALVDFCRSLGAGEAPLTLEQVANGMLPDGLRGRAVMISFTKDLAEFLSETGDEGRQFILRICDDTDLAAKVFEDEGMPKPVRYLAKCATSVREGTLKAPKTERKVGFCAA